MLHLDTGWGTVTAPHLFAETAAVPVMHLVELTLPDKVTGMVTDQVHLLKAEGLHLGLPHMGLMVSGLR